MSPTIRFGPIEESNNDKNSSNESESDFKRASTFHYKVKPIMEIDMKKMPRMPTFVHKENNGVVHFEKDEKLLNDIGSPQQYHRRGIGNQRRKTMKNLRFMQTKRRIDCFNSPQKHHMRMMSPLKF